MRREDPDPAAEASGFVLGLACGAILGAALGLLFAPRSGAQSRTWIAEQSRTVARRVRISQQEATEIVRQKGVRGLLKVLRGGGAGQAPGPAGDSAAAESADSGTPGTETTGGNPV